jgi:hypothetical protein
MHNAPGGKEKWMELCEQAANEQDSQKLAELVVAIIAALDEKEKRLKNPAFDSSPVPDSPQTSTRPEFWFAAQSPK